MEEKVEPGELLTFYACPICRFTFRANLNESSAVQCPGCKLLVRVKADVNVVRSSKDELDKIEELRMASWDKVAEKSSSAPSGEAVDERSAFVKYILLAAILLVMLICIVVMITLFSGQKKSSSALEVENLERAYEPISKSGGVEKVSAEVLSPSVIESIKKDATQYFSTFNVEEFWPLIDQRRLEKKRIAELLETFPKKTWSEMELLSISLTKAGIVRAEFGNGESEGLLIFKEVNGEFKIDWASSTGYSVDQIGALKSGEKKEVTLRVIVVQKDYYTTAVPEDKFKSFSIEMSFEQLSVYGYVELSNEALLTQLDNLARFEGGKATLIMSHFINEVGENQFVIKEVVAENWLENTKN